MSSALSVAGLAIDRAASCWMLLAWPLIVRRFFSDRQFADLLAGDHAPVHRRAPDAGLTWLGWLLIAQAAMTASFLIPQLILGRRRWRRSPAWRRGDSTSCCRSARVGMRSIWWSVGLVALQGWAGYELVRMSPRARIDRHGVRRRRRRDHRLHELADDPGAQARWRAASAHGRRSLFAPLALALVIPVATLAARQPQDRADGASAVPRPVVQSSSAA